jgi:uncharacterized repeat protein (TIGR03803 family)
MGVQSLSRSRDRYFGFHLSQEFLQRGFLMFRPQSLISGLHPRRIRAELAFAVVLAAALATSPSSQAQTYLETVVHNFAGPYGNSPNSLVAGRNGNLYGTTGSGGAYNLGTVFQIDKTGKEIVLYSFKGKPDGYGPVTLLVNNSGEFYGLTYRGGTFGFGTVFKLDMSGNEVVLYSFTGGSDGSYPNGLVQDAAGNLYGTTSGGGTSGFGTVFELTPDGTETVLHSFAGAPDGESPSGGLIRDAAGNLYGTTLVGGPYQNCGFWSTGCGIVFKISSEGKESALYSFYYGGKGLDGEQPSGTLVQDAAGNLYGTTQDGGGDGLYGDVYMLSPAGEETILYSFFGDDDGENPMAGVVRDAAGNLYGTTYQGGNKGNCYGGFFYSGCGTAFEISPSGLETQLHIFTGRDGVYPLGNSLIRDAAGKLYGTTQGGGAYGAGVVFKLTPQ